jgi:hypothetical protein
LCAVRPGSTTSPWSPETSFLIKADYQGIANDLPIGAILVVLPPSETVVGKAMQAAVDHFRAERHQVTMIAAERLAAYDE